MFSGKVILVTGGTGSIGSEIVRQLLKHEPKTIRIFSRDESKQFDMQQELSEYSNIRYLIGDIRDKERLGFAAKGVDIIFHAAALKHVPSCEYNPFEAVKTNVIGTQNVIEVAIENNVEKMISVSTDKVVNPMNTMGATKLLSEKLMSVAGSYKGTARTSFACVRFGNVMGSRGSVIPLFKDQIKASKPITVTDKGMTRFMMSIPQAAKLVLDAAQLSKGGETYVLKMPVLYIKDMAEVLMDDFLNKIPDAKPTEIIEVGIRPGEKIYEELMTEEESERAFENEKMYVISSHLLKEFMPPADFRKSETQAYSSRNVSVLSKEEIHRLLESANLLF